MTRQTATFRVEVQMARLGFDLAALPFTMRTALAACAALLLGWAAGLDHPQWAAMTVWSASQPLRGQIIEKSLFRMAGTVAGVVAGVVFLLVSKGDLVILVLAVSLWTAVCAAAGNLQRGYLAYGVTLAGYSAAMVALLDYSRPAHIMTLATDRLLTVLLGVVVAMIVGLLFAPRRSEGLAAGHVRRLSAVLLRAMAKDLRGDAAGDREAQTLLAEAALINDTLEPQAPGSPGSRREARSLGRILAAQVSAIVWLRRPSQSLGSSSASSTAETLEAAAAALESAAPPAEMLAKLEKTSLAAVGDPALQAVLLDLETTVRDHLQGKHAPGERARRAHPGVLHRDWIGAREAGVRSLAVMLLMGTVWVVTGWSTGPYLMLGAAVMTSVFSSMDFPARTIGYVLRGTTLGVAGAMICRWLVWPLAAQPIDLIFLTLPFILIGPFVMAHRRTGEGAFDYNMHLLLLLPPIFPLSGSLDHSLAVALAVVAGPAAAWLGYRYIYPATLSRRLDTLILMMVREVEAMAASPDAAVREPAWRARLRHRMLRLSRWVEKSGDREISAVGGGLAILTLGQATIALHRLEQALVLPPRAADAVRQTLGRIRILSRDPDAVVTALTRTANALPRGQADEARLMLDAAAVVAQHQTSFFPRSASSSTRPRRRP